MYAKNQIVSWNYAEAVRLFLKAAEQGNAAAKYNLGAMYEEGLGASKDLKEAEKWYGLAAKQGDAEAQKALESINKNKDVSAPPQNSLDFRWGFFEAISKS